MRKAKKSIHVEVVALSLFIGVLALYAVFSTFGSNANAAGAADAKCQASWEKFKQEAIQKEDPDPVKYADGKNGAIPCTDDKGSTGHCNAVEGSQSPKVICGGEKDKYGNTASKEGLDKAKKAMEDGKKKEEPKGGGGEPPKMPEMPKKEPKKEEPKDQSPCPNGKPRGVDGKCPSDNPPPSFESFWDKVKNTMPEGVRKALSLDEPDKLSPIEELDRVAKLINENPAIGGDEKLERIEATQKYLTGARDWGNQQSVDDIVAYNNKRPVDDVENAAGSMQDDLRALAQSQVSVEPVGSINPQSSGNVITEVAKWFRGLFGF